MTDQSFLFAVPCPDEGTMTRQSGLDIVVRTAQDGALSV